MKRLLLLLVMLSLAGLTVAQEAKTPADLCAAALPATEPATREYELAQDVLEVGVDYRAILCTEAGPVYVDLFETYAPTTVNSFVFLAQVGYYNNTTFHRVLQDFMAQGGDPTGTGSGGPGYQFRDEFLAFMTFDRTGLLAMANANSPEQGIVGTNGSQFFITTAVTDWLNYRHTIFGEVLEGQEVVAALKLRDPNQSPDFTGAALNTVLIVTDPSTVQAAEPVAVELSPAETVSSSLDGLQAGLPEDLTITSQTLTTDELSATAPADSQAGYADYLAEYGHSYRVSRDVANATCNEQYYFSQLAYRMDAFGSAAQASAALYSPFLVELNTANGFTGGELSESWRVPVFTKAVETCSGATGQLIRGYFARGAYVVEVEVLLADEILAQVAPEVVLDEGVAAVFEQFLIGVYRPSGN